MRAQAALPSDPAGRRPRAVRRLRPAVLLSAPLALAGAVLPLGPAAAESAAAYGAPTTRCEITDDRLAELSGLAGAGSALLAMDDGGDRVEVYVLDERCQVAEVRTGEVDPYDPEDMALAADGTVWIEDAGDNRAQRATVAMIALHPDGTTAVTRMTYPDGPHDAEALLLAPDGTPYLVTKEVLGASSVYRPDAPLTDGATVPMSKVADLGFTLTGTPGGPVGRAGQLLVTGGAVSADGALIALRTYTDAYVWPLEGSDVAGALQGTPTRVALPDSPQGEAITFGENNRDLVVSSEGLPAAVTVLPAQAPIAPPAGQSAAAKGAAAESPSSDPAPWVPAAVIAAVLAAVVVWAGSRLRRRRTAAPEP
ncbi:hypothetical protein [Modestobacter sp. NPDC049651]|uniref:hypothetical protein n=1 Tax=unclassified Modestobacter TaxID=2643866 RepID=UPI00340682D6